MPSRVARATRAPVRTSGCEAFARNRGSGAGECPNQAFTTVSDRVIADHLQGRHAVEVYPLLLDETCWFITADFDKANWMADTAAFGDACNAAGLPIHVERSRSGNGAHAWFFFGSPVPAVTARRMACFLESVVRLMGADLPVPAYSAVCRRQAGLDPQLHPSPPRQARHVVIDTTGLKVFGAGEWHLRKYGRGKGRRRTWRKLHLCVAETSKDIVAVDLTTSAVHDSPHLPAALDQVEGDVSQVSADRAYDSGTCYAAILERGAVPTIAPRRNARFSRAKDPPPFRAEREPVLRRIRDEGRIPWRTSSGAIRQSLVENAVSRFKALVGVKPASRDLGRQQVEALVKSQVLNRMAALGMPGSERISMG